VAAATAPMRRHVSPTTKAIVRHVLMNIEMVTRSA
jgi:hypothetical protein